MAVSKSLYNASTGVWYEDPDPSNPLANFYFYWIPAGVPGPNVCAADGGPPCYADYPQIGFNTNWIGVTADYFGPAYQPAVAAIPRQPAECSGTFSNQQMLFTLANFVHVTPAETYYNNGTDQYGSSLYLAWVENQTNAQIGIGKITGTPSSPTITPLVATVAPSPPTGWGWQNEVGMVQSGGGLTINPGPGDDRFTGFVARNNYLWLTHSIGIPWNGTAETNANCTTTPSACRNFGQFWQIATSNLTLAHPPVRWGPSTTGITGQPSTQYDVIDPSIAVNAKSDFVMGFETVAPSDYLQAQYTYHDHTLGAGSLKIPFTFRYGGGEYVQYLPPLRLAVTSRTGDFGHANPDPVDDNSLFVGAGYAGSNWSVTSYYGWSHGWAMVKPPPITFIGSQNVETEGCGTNFCLDTLTIAAPAGVQNGDVLVAALDSSDGYSTAPTLPTGWTILPIVNRGNAKELLSYDGVGDYEAEWMLAYKYGTVSPDPGVYNFAVVDSPSSETGALLLGYRGASTNFSSYAAYGYPFTGLFTSASAGPITPPANTQLIGLFHAGSDECSGFDCAPSQFTPAAGYPPLNPETPLSWSPTANVLTMVGADLFTAGFTGFSYGPYTASEGDTSGAISHGWLLEMPPQ